jgi:Family of unknown function (DUF5522)
MSPDPLAERPPDELHPSRLAADDPRRTEIIDAHRTAMLAGASGYTDPESGLHVFTAVWLRDRSSCCHTGCRHCPYIE